MRHNSYRIEGLPDLIWGNKATTHKLECPSCGSHDIYYSGTPEDPEEILSETVRCGVCGWLTDYYEMYKQAKRRSIFSILCRLLGRQKGSQ